MSRAQGILTITWKIKRGLTALSGSKENRVKSVRKNGGNFSINIIGRFNV